MSRDLVLLTPYRLPTHNTLMLSAEDVATFLNGYLTLWNPALLPVAVAPPRVASPYDHEQPQPGHVYAVPENPPLFLPDDWDERVATAGAKAFRATPSRADTEMNLFRALGREPGTAGSAAAFYGLGFGYLVLEGLFEAMDHLNQIAVGDFWQDVVRAAEAADEATRLQHLRAAAGRLREAREILYPNNVFLVDLVLPEEYPIDGPWPPAFDFGAATNFIVAAERLVKLAEAKPFAMQRVREQVQAGVLEICGGPYREREDALLPVESQLWNLRRGMASYRELLGQDIRVFARRRFAASPQLPQHLSAVGLTKAILLPLDDGVIPQYRSAVTEWTAADGKRVQAFTRSTQPAESALTYFHLAYYLARTMMQDATATFAVLSRGPSDAPWQRDWFELDRLAPVFGQWVTLDRLFNEVAAGEYPSPPIADDFHSNYLEELVDRRAEQPISRFKEHSRRRQRFDATATIAGLCRSIVKRPGDSPLPQQLLELEESIEQNGNRLAELDVLRAEAAKTLAEKLVSRAAQETPGFLVLNPCSFTRRVPVELANVSTPLPAPAKATQVDAQGARAVIEVPGLGFAWVPVRVAPGTRVPIPRVKLAEKYTLRSDVLEAEIDPQTGGLRSIRDTRGRGSRLGQQLVYGPGSMMRAKDVRVTSSGPALGEIVTEGAIFDAHEQVLATFRQRFRVWWSRPILELRIELYPQQAPAGYPWHGYYAARFAWRGERAPMFRAVNRMTTLTSQTRPETADFVEIRSGSERTAILMGGLPFHQRHEQRMLDVILICEGETSQAFDLGLALDPEEPIQSAVDFLTPTVVVPVAKGPPQIGATGWLYHLNAANVLLSALLPTADGADAVIVRLTESRTIETAVELRCPRNPVRAVVTDERDTQLEEAPVKGDAVELHFAPGEMKRIRIDYA